jgi:putative membrane protein
MKQILFRIVAISSLTLLAGGMAMAQMRGSESTPQSSTPTNGSPNSVDQMQQQAAVGAMQDKDFARGALEGGMAEVQLGQLAAEKGSSGDVKQFGQKMVEDHTQLGDQLKPLAQQMGVNPPDGLSKKDKALVAKLNTLSGAQFDEVYIEAMVKDHKKDLSDFKAEANNTQNPQLKQTVEQGSQMIDQHLQMIEQIAKAHNLKS